MDIITSIENALKSINEAKFQKMINHLLIQQGYKFILSPGSVVGKEKTRKGTPDSFFENDKGYVFVECTTKQNAGKSLFNKLSKDIDHCFNEDVTKIENTKINEVILACNGIITVEEYDSLKQKVLRFNPNSIFNFLNIHNLTYSIIECPEIASMHLGVKILKGEIQTLESFLNKSKKSLQPSLTNDFIGREEIFLQCIKFLDNGDKLLLTGAAGVGKSKLAVQLMETFSERGFIPLVVQSSLVPLWENLHSIFKNDKKYIVLVDDANKAIKNFGYLLDLSNNEKSYELKIIITSRDYVKQQVSTLLNDFIYEELNVPIFTDEDIGKIIVAVLPNLKNYFDLKKRIIELARGNARLALMATNSVTPGSKNKYLENSVLLYDEYFKKISAETEIFAQPTSIKALGIIHFFGVLDKNNEILRVELETHFDINWNELWSVIIELHNNEFVDLHSNQVVRISDQVLGTYAFYIVFIDQKSFQIEYSLWVKVFIKNHYDRINNSLIDTNNTFGYAIVKDFIKPELVKILSSVSEENQYSVIKIFWLYEQRQCLLFIKNWIDSLPQEDLVGAYEVKYEQNNHTSASKYFELLLNFWNQPNELFETSIELLLNLNLKQPNQYPETLKFLNDYFVYKVSDVYDDYKRQHLIIKILFKFEARSAYKKIIRGIILSLTKSWLKWHHTDFTSTKGRAFNITNFTLNTTDQLLKFRSDFLLFFSNNFDSTESICTEILDGINQSRGVVDQSLYIIEKPLYEIIIKSLDTTQYLHCKFVKSLSKKIIKAGDTIPPDWELFVNSDVMKLSNFLRPSWDDDRHVNLKNSEKEKKEEFHKFISAKTWPEIKHFLISVDQLNKQQLDNSFWFIENAITDLFIIIAKYNKQCFINALEMFFSGEIKFKLTTNIFSHTMADNIISAEELLEIINRFSFDGKVFWTSAVLYFIPNSQVDSSMLKLLVNVYSEKSSNLCMHNMLEHLKYEKEFTKLKIDDENLQNHNIITFLTEKILCKELNYQNDFGWDFFTKCASYFTRNKNLLSQAYWREFTLNPHFDFEGEQLMEVLNINNDFIIESIASKKIGFGYSSKIRFENIKSHVLWQLENYENVIGRIVFTVLDLSSGYYFYNEQLSSLFLNNEKFNNADKMKNFILKLLNKHPQNLKLIDALLSIVYDNFRDFYITYLRSVIILNPDINILKEINFSRTESWSGSRIPLIQGKINFYKSILEMITKLPNPLNYIPHVELIEQRILWKKEDIKNELARDFIEEYY